MTKYEWETELKKNIRRLPADEVRRVLDYYAEMFEDYIERGKTEIQIINEFGNPADVADKIVSEYDGELLDESLGDVPVPTVKHEPADDSSDERAEIKTPAPQTNVVITEEIVEDDTANKHSGGKRRVAAVFAYIGFGLLALLAAVFVCFGLYIAATAFAVFANNGVSALTQFGIGLMILGVGLALVYPALKVFAKGSSPSHENSNEQEKGNEVNQ